MKIRICAVCGRVINEDEDTVYTINEGTDREYIECEQCHDQEWEEEFMEDVYIPKFSVVVRFCNQSRGYIVSANSRQEAMKKLVDKIDMTGVDSINIAEILLDEDVF